MLQVHVRVHSEAPQGGLFALLHDDSRAPLCALAPSPKRYGASETVLKTSPRGARKIADVPCPINRRDKKRDIGGHLGHRGYFPPFDTALRQAQGLLRTIGLWGHPGTFGTLGGRGAAVYRRPELFGHEITRKTRNGVQDLYP